MGDEQDPSGFKVEDKRRFTETGQSRGEDEASEQTGGAGAASEPTGADDTGASAPGENDASAPTGASTSDENDASAPTGADDTGTSTPGENDASEPGGAENGAARELPALNFSSFVVGLATQALTFLGAVPDRQSGKVEKNLREASAIIDILSMMADKTKGNLAEDEDRLLQEMIYDLQMRFVAESRGSGEQA